MKAMQNPTCRACGAELRDTFVDLGVSPLANSYVSLEQVHQLERFYPLHVKVCAGCFLVQLESVVEPEEVFSDYAYFSSYSDSWVEHAKTYACAAIQRFGLTNKSHVVEIASNDGYLLQHFVARKIPVLGIEPARNVAEVAQQRGIPTLVKFFGELTAQELSREGKQADLIIGNNVLAHVPQLIDFVKGLKNLLSPNGVITLEFPHLMRLMEENQFDTIYHEHFSYFSLQTVSALFDRLGLKVFDVEELLTHGGSLRIYACHRENQRQLMDSRVKELLAREAGFGLGSLETYFSFGEQVKALKRELLLFLIRAKTAGKTVVGYGAPAKGNTLLNYCGVRSDLLEYTVDRSPHKQGRFLPGTRIPVYAPDRIKETQPDYVLILPWNLREEIMGQMHYVRDWNGSFVVPIPSVTVL